MQYGQGLCHDVGIGDSVELQGLHLVNVEREVLQFEILDVSFGLCGLATTEVEAYKAVLILRLGQKLLLVLPYGWGTEDINHSLANGRGDGEDALRDQGKALRIYLGRELKPSLGPESLGG